MFSNKNELISIYDFMAPIVAIILASLILILTIYYSISPSTKYKTDENVSEILKQGQQIQGAIIANIDRNADAKTIILAIGSSTLENYLKETPTFDNIAWGAVGAAGTGTDAVATSGYSYIAVSDSLCHALNIKAGIADIDGITDLTVTTGLFGCITTSDEAFYKVGAY